MAYEMLPQYLDSYKLPGAGQPMNMGDSCADYFTILATTDMYDSLELLFWDHSCYAPVRHPDMTQWWGQPNRVSRDQFIPILCYSIMRNSVTPFIKRLFLSHLTRGLCFCWNTRTGATIPGSLNFPDVTFLEVAGLWLRVFKPFGYKLLLPVCDLETLANSLLWKYYQPATNNLTRNFLLVLAAQRKDPSFISNIAYKISNLPDLISRWAHNTAICGEYPTAPLIEGALK